MKKIHKLILLVLGLGLTGILFHAKFSQATESRINLRTYSNNLDILSDKDGNLDELIGELQNFRTYVATGAVLGSTISVPGILPTDTIREIVVYTSASIVCGSTVIGKAGDSQIVLQSRVPGIVGFTFNANVIQKNHLNTSSASLTINTTGYAFEIQLASGTGTLSPSSGSAIIDAINSHPWLSRLVRASTSQLATSFDTSSFKMDGTGVRGGVDLTNQYFWNGVNQPYVTSLSSRPFSVGVYTIPGQYATISSSGNVVISTSAPLTKEDYLELKVHGYRQD